MILVGFQTYVFPWLPIDFYQSNGQSAHFYLYQFLIDKISNFVPCTRNLIGPVCQPPLYVSLCFRKKLFFFEKEHAENLPSSLNGQFLTLKGLSETKPSCEILTFEFLGTLHPAKHSTLSFRKTQMKSFQNYRMHFFHQGVNQQFFLFKTVTRLSNVAFSSSK